MTVNLAPQLQPATIREGHNISKMISNSNNLSIEINAPNQVQYNKN